MRSHDPAVSIHKHERWDWLLLTGKGPGCVCVEREQLLLSVLKHNIVCHLNTFQFKYAHARCICVMRLTTVNVQQHSATSAAHSKEARSALVPAENYSNHARQRQERLWHARQMELRGHRLSPGVTHSSAGAEVPVSATQDVCVQRATLPGQRSGTAHGKAWRGYTPATVKTDRLRSFCAFCLITRGRRMSEMTPSYKKHNFRGVVRAGV